jgi:hypothetical protein
MRERCDSAIKQISERCRGGIPPIRLTAVIMWGDTVSHSRVIPFRAYKSFDGLNEGHEKTAADYG